MNRSPRSIGRSPGLSSPSVARGPAVSIRWQDSGIPFQSSSRTASRSVMPGPQAEQQPSDAARGLARGVLEGGQLLDLVDRRAARRPASISRSVAFSTEPARADQPAELVDEERRRVDRGPVGVGLPADDADPAARPDPLVGEDLGQRARPIARLARQAEVLEQVRDASAAAPRRPSRSTRCRRGSPGRPSGPTTSTASSKRGSKPVR